MSNANLDRLRQIQAASQYSPHRHTGTWDDNLARLIDAHVQIAEHEARMANLSAMAQDEPTPFPPITEAE